MNLKNISGYSDSASITKIGIGFLSLGIFVAILVAGQNVYRTSLIAANFSAIIENSNVNVRNFQADTSQDLIKAFDTEHYVWPPSDEQTIPPLILEELPSDFANLKDHKLRQELFLRAILPMVLVENRRIREQRYLAELLLEDDLSEQDPDKVNWLKKLAKQYRVPGDLSRPEVSAKLLNRMDIIPPALALAQSAIETGWGTSRFAMEGNSLFGQWTFRSSNGLKPSNRSLDAKHYVASFPTLRDSVKAYMRNLNIGHAYREFRKKRASLRAEGDSLRADELAVYLHRYSQRGENYVADLQRMIKSRHIDFLSNTNLNPEEPKLFLASLGSVH